MKEIYQVLAAAMGQQDKLDQIANNLANVNTVGFKRDSAIFRNFFELAQEAAGVTGPLPAGQPSIPTLADAYTDFSQGPAIATGKNLDLMIEGEGFFEIEAPGAQGAFYTRAGAFHLNEADELVTAENLRVLDGRGGAITINTALGDPVITPEGEIKVGGATVATIELLKFPNPQLLSKIGNGLFAAPADEVAEIVAEPRLRQGFLEGSNVNPIDQMIKMLQTQNAYITQQKAMKAIDDVTGERISQVLNG